MQRRIKVLNNLGVHARVAAKIVKLGRNYKSDLFIRRNSREVDGSSILSILSLACPRGAEIELRIEGEDEKNFMEALTGLFNERFGEPR